MQYIVRNRRRLRPTTGEQARTVAPVAAPSAVPAPALAEGSGLHRRPTTPLVTEINLTRPFQGRLR
ncbi:MAG: hypothetical protein JWP01_732 [Myxococcales bacterium]|nr:hypothetical protein [Myxococcales bacterium]